MFNPFIPLVEFTPVQAVGILAPLVLGALCLIALLILLGVQLGIKRRLKATKIVLAASVILLAIGVVTVLASGAIEIGNGADGNSASRSDTAEFESIDFHVDDVITFSSTDKDGNPVDSSLFKDSKVTLVNCWETWCVACKDEMPDLQELYEKYQDEGFNIIGIYSDENDLQEVLDNTGVTYPIIRACDELNAESQKSMPSSFFVDSEGRILKVPTNLPNVGGGLGIKNKCILTGSRTAEGWEALILYYLGK